MVKLIWQLVGKEGEALRFNLGFFYFFLSPFSLLFSVILGGFLLGFFFSFFFVCLGDWKFFFFLNLGSL